MLRVGLLITAIGALLVVGVGALLAHSLRGLAKEERLRHQIVAERLFDELERELTDLTLREESRSFLEYRYFYVPEAQLPGLAGLARSPLSSLPDDPAVLGWFQLEPDGTLYTPFRPRPSELQLAEDNYAEPSDPAVAVVEAELLELLDEVAWGDEGPQVTALAQQVRNQQAKVEVAQELSNRRDLYSTLNRAINSREQRVDWSTTAQRQEVEPFQVNEGDIQSVLSTNLMEQQVAQAVDSTRAREDNLDEVGVRVSPLAGMLLDPEHLLLHRSVTIDGETWRQGLVLLLPALEAGLADAVLGDSPLAPHVGLDWGLRSAPARRYDFVHVFAAPFADLSLRARLDRIPGQRSASGAVVVGLSGLLLLLSALGGLVLYRAVAARMELAQRRSDFVAAVSHELKTPLTSIRMMAEILRDGMVPGEERRQQYYETITAESERLSRLIGNVLELARLERGTRPVERVVGPVYPVLEQVVEILGPHAKERGFVLETELAADLPAASMDRDALLQVLVNLVDNAIKFAASAEDKRVVIQARAVGAEVVLSVRDHGPGVPAGQLRRIFQPFYRGERELTRRTKGTGIGLALVAGLVARMGGRVDARNHPEGGLEVRVVLAGA
jgi:signal transduction histidine kinase